jgi:hypothetical protein
VQWTHLILTVCRFFQASDQLLDPADMAVYGCTPDPDRGHTPDFLLSRANDQLLIPLFHEKGIRDDHLHRLNLCRLFLLPTISISQPAAEPRSQGRMEGVRDTTYVELPMASTRTTQCPGLILWRKSLTKALSLQTANSRPPRAMASTEAVSVVL